MDRKHVPDRMKRRNMVSLLWDSCRRCITWIYSWRNIRQTKMRDYFVNKWHIAFKCVKIMNIKRKWRSVLAMMPCGYPFLTLLRKFMFFQILNPQNQLRSWENERELAINIEMLLVWRNLLMSSLDRNRKHWHTESRSTFSGGARSL